MYGYTPSFPAMFSKGDNFHDFLFAYLEKMGSTLKGKIASMGANSLFYEMTPIYMGGNNENDRVASPESVP